MADTEIFESADAGASETIPMEAGQIKKGGYICIKGRPCKVVSISTSKTGKHGHAKCKITGIDIFTKNKIEGIESSSHNMKKPFVDKSDWALIDINEEGFCNLMAEEDSECTREDLKLPEKYHPDVSPENYI